MRIAIVGTGIAGLVCAHRLHGRHDVAVFEAEDRVGGHTHTVDVEVEGERHAVDTGFIVYNEATYPHFSALLRELGVATRPTEMSFGVSCERTGVEWASRGPRSLFAQPRNLLRPPFLGMLRDVLRFHRDARALLESGDEKVTLRDYLAGAGYGPRLAEHYLVPMGAAIWSASPDALLDFPAASFVRFFANHGLLEARPSLPWRVVAGGSARYVEALVAPFRERIRLRAPVRGVRRRAGSVEVASGAGRERFDHVVLALHGDQALALLEDATPVERRVLGAFSYQENDVVLHTDASVLPARPRAEASWNYRVPREPADRVFVTYDMNRLQGLRSRHRFLVTLNGTRHLDPRRILGRFRYAHPVFDGRALAAQKLHAEVSRGRTHFAGAYWGWGFHEDGVRSALRACAALEGG